MRLLNSIGRATAGPRPATALTLVLCSATTTHAQTIATNPVGGSNVAHTLAQCIVGEGITVTNATLKGSPTKSVGFFYDGMNPIGIGSGVVMSSGWVSEVDGPCNDQWHVDHPMGYSGDAQLTALAGHSTFDAVVLEFDFIAPPAATTLDFQFVFSSEEYNDFEALPYTDLFAAFLNGPNIALVAGEHVAIDNVSRIKNSQYYVDNDCASLLGLQKGTGFPCCPSTAKPIEMNGFTTVLTASGAVNPGGLNHLKLAIADVTDPYYDSNVFISCNNMDAGLPDFVKGPCSDETPLHVCVGETLQRSIEAVPTNGLFGECVSLTASGYPIDAGATGFPVLCANSASTLLTWKPEESDVGLWPVTITATDQLGVTKDCVFYIEVTYCTRVSKRVTNDTTTDANGVEMLIDGHWELQEIYNVFEGVFKTPGFSVAHVGSNRTKLRWWGHPTPIAGWVKPGMGRQIGFMLREPAVEILGLNWAYFDVAIPGCVTQVNIVPPDGGTSGGVYTAKGGSSLPPPPGGGLTEPGTILFANTVDECDSKTVYIGALTVKYFVDPPPGDDATMPGPALHEDFVPSLLCLLPGAVGEYLVPTPPLGANFALLEFEVGTSPNLGGPGTTEDFLIVPIVRDWEPAVSLTGAPAELSLSLGGTQTLQLDAGPESAFDLYLVLGSMSGTTPGLPLADGPFLPLNPDSYFGATLAQPNQPPLGNSSGFLDAAGLGSATFSLPPGLSPALAGLQLHHAFVVLDLVAVKVTFASNAVAVDLLP